MAGDDDWGSKPSESSDEDATTSAVSTSSDESDVDAGPDISPAELLQWLRCVP